MLESGTVNRLVIGASWHGLLFKSWETGLLVPLVVKSKQPEHFTLLLG